MKLCRKFLQLLTFVGLMALPSARAFAAASCQSVLRLLPSAADISTTITSIAHFKILADQAKAAGATGNSAVLKQADSLYQEKMSELIAKLSDLETSQSLKEKISSEIRRLQKEEQIEKKTEEQVRATQAKSNWPNFKLVSRQHMSEKITESRFTEVRYLPKINTLVLRNGENLYRQNLKTNAAKKIADDVSRMQLLPDGKSVLIFNKSFTHLSIRDIASGKTLSLIPVSDIGDVPQAYLTVSPDGKTAALRTSSEVFLVDLNTGKKTLSLSVKDQFKNSNIVVLTDVSFLTNDRLLIDGTGASTRTVGHYDISTGNTFLKDIEPSNLESLISSDRRELFTSRYDYATHEQSFRFYSTDNFELISSRKTDYSDFSGSVNSLLIPQAPEFLLLVGAHGAQVSGIFHRENLLEPLLAFTSEYGRKTGTSIKSQGITFSPDGKKMFIISTGNPNSASWDRSFDIDTWEIE